MDSRLLDILVCPATKGKLVLKQTEKSTDKGTDKSTETCTELWSRSAGLAYPVTDGIPCMVESKARTLSNEEIASIKEKKT